MFLVSMSRVTVERETGPCVIQNPVWFPGNVSHAMFGKRQETKRKGRLQLQHSCRERKATLLSSFIIVTVVEGDVKD